MFRDKNEELKRLEEALMEEPEEIPEEETRPEEYLEEGVLEEYEEAEADGDITAYTNISSDVDLEDYSEEVYQGKKKSGYGFWVGLLVVQTVLICVIIFLILWQGGFLG